MNKQDFAQLLMHIAAYFDVSLNPMQIEAYWVFLSSYELEEISEALFRYCKNPDAGRYFPKASEIIATIHGDSRNQALKAWTKVITAISRVGGYSSVAFDDSLIHAVLRDMGGWKKMCLTEEREMPFVAKEFQERYRGYVANPPRHYPPYLLGLIENKNSVYEPVVMIGNIEKVSKVIAGGKDQPLLINYSKRLNQLIPTE